MANTKITSNVISDDITLGGNPTTTTQSAGNNTTRIATTAFVKTAIDATIDSAPGALDTLNELAAAIGDDANFSTTVTNSIALKAPLASPDFTGQVQVTNSATTVQEFIVTGNNTRSALSMQSKDSSGNAVDLRMHSLGDGPRGEIFTFTNHDLAFSTNNAAPQITLQTSGNFGIGTDNPATHLHVYDSTSHAEIRVGTSGASDAKVPAFSLNNTQVEWSVATKSDNHLHFRENTQSYATRMLIKSGNGFVGIGGGTANNPRYNLTVAGNNSTAIGIALDNASGSSTLDIAALGSSYNNHQAGAGEVWFFSPDTINIGGATGHTNDVKFIANNSVNMIIKGANGRVGIGVTGPAANLAIYGSTDSAGATQNVIIKNTTTASYSSTAFVGTGRGLDFFTNSANDQDFTAIRFSNSDGSRETAIAVVQDSTTTSDGTGQGDVVIQGYDGDGYIETQRFRANGASSSTGQRRTGGYTSFAYINHTYTFDHNNYSTAGTPSNTNEHWLEVPLYSSYSSSSGGGWMEMDICWHASHAQAAHLHSYKIIWGSAHTRILNISVISSSANCTTASYNPYRFTSSSRLYRNPTAGDAYMTKMYVQIMGSTNHSGGRSITLRGVGHPGVKNLAPVIDHGGDSTPDGITPTAETSAITVYG